MVKSNEEHARTIQQALKRGLLDEIIRLSKALHEEEYIVWIGEKAKIFNLRNDEERLRKKVDSQALLKVIAYGWKGQLETQFNGDAEDLSSHAHFLLKNLRNLNSHDSDDNLTRLNNPSLLPAVANVAIDLLVAFNTNESRSSADRIRRISGEASGEIQEEPSSSSHIPESVLIAASERQAEESLKTTSEINEPHLNAPNIEQHSTLTHDAEEKVPYDSTEPSGKAMNSRDATATGNVEGKVDARDYIKRRNTLNQENLETPTQIVEQKFQFYDTTIQDDTEEDTRENKAIRGNGKRKRSKSNRPKRKRPDIKSPAPKGRSSPNTKQRSRPWLGVNINSNNRQVTYERSSKDSKSETQIRNIFIPIALVISIVIIVLLVPELLKPNLSAWLLVLISIGVIYKVFHRWLEHREDMKRMELESQRKSIFQRVKEFGKGLLGR